MRAEDLELITGSVLVVIAVAAVILPLVATVTMLIFREKKPAAIAVPKVSPAGVVTPPREKELAVAS